MSRIMVQGTCSSAGKSLLVTALCRIFWQDGYKVAPFKSQNMALNSFVTVNGLEMGRAQVVQAEACKILPDVRMNPVLIKPSSDMKSQVIVEGKVFNNMNVMDYYGFKKSLKKIITKNYKKLEEEYEVIVLEGAGSPAEINLKKNDFVNMGMAKIADSPVIIVGDIDKGGVFASLVGTLKLLTAAERKRVKGVVINKFRGDIKLLKPGLEMLEKIIKIPVLGVIPYLNVEIEDEDSVTERLDNRSKKRNPNEIIDIAVIKLPYMSNFTDLNPFYTFNDVNVRFVNKTEDFGSPDLVIIPGSKNTINDLKFIKENGLAKKIEDTSNNEKVIFGICGGYQIMGRVVNDPYKIEGDCLSEEGLGFFDMETTFEKVKKTAQVKGIIEGLTGEFSSLNGLDIIGYEIHMGVSTYGDNKSFINIDNELTGSYHKNIFGTYVHGVFDNLKFTNQLLNIIRLKKGIEKSDNNDDFIDFKDKQYDLLACNVRDALDMDKIYGILNGDI